MLVAADEPLATAGWTPLDASWKAVPSPDPSLANHRHWLPHFVVRQYFRKEDPMELFTLAAIIHDPYSERIEQPLGLASRMRRSETRGDDIYWVPTLQLRRIAGLEPMGKVVRIRLEDLEPQPWRLKAWNELVLGDELLSIAVPLVSVVDDESLRKQLIAPLLEAQFVMRPSGLTQS